MPDPPVRFTDHARKQAERYSLDLDEALEIVHSPQQVVNVREFRQSLLDKNRGLLRVLVETTHNEIVVVTMYRTSKVDKYWQR